MPKRARLLQTGSFRVILKIKLHSAGDLAAAQAASADVNMLGASVHDGLDALHIGLPCTVGSSVGVADLDTKGNALITKFALCHSLKHLLACVSLNRQLLYNNRTAGQLQEQIM
jgi:hypothetical protein